ncbi:serine/threonine-protein kinase [Streptomyces sp. NBC_00557]|uniref:serine/threonine-protein kinase n=1 Tax=Streptomyces sp. NBC_00557 TaxID=2975776 RepID=UPI002E810436|nr:serine/threonine-protein kinase [Streptomyces sp. NBC_00557]WUC39356.1 serine/threonine-protein kinase [Streptomyces sp. NBC_00557]
MTGAQEAAGRVITGRYRLLRRLGTGGMGRVWLAYDQELACEVALKEIILPPDVPECEMGSRIARARGEARHAARLRNHPHVVTVHDIVEEDGLPWIVMEYVPDAMDLEAVVRERGPLPPRDVARIGLAVLDALLEGHRLGVLHRDVKPANILLTHPEPQPAYPTEGGGRVMLADYGLALEPSSGEDRLTATLEILGTPRFMAPERANSQPPTPAADLFSLGATLYYALEGVGPFDRDTALTSLSALLFESPRPPRRATELTPVLVGLLAKDPADRMDGEEAARRLACIADQPHPSPIQEPVPSPEVPPPELPSAPKPPCPQEPAAPTEVVLPAEVLLPAELEEPTRPPPESLPHEGDEALLRLRPPRPRIRRAGLIAGVTLVALAAAGGGIYLAQSPSSGPEAAVPSVSSIQVGNSPGGVAVSPDGRRAYATNYFGPASVSVIDTATNRTVGNPIEVGSKPQGVVVSPDGRRAYVANSGSASVSVIDTATNRTVGKPIGVGKNPIRLAVSPDGRRTYTANAGSDSVSVIDTATNHTAGNPIPVGDDPQGLAISPDGRRAYTVNAGSDSVSVIDTATNHTAGNPIEVGKNPVGVAVSPDGRRAYTVNAGSDSVSVIDTATNHTVGNPIEVGKNPVGVAVSPDGRRAYAANAGSDSVSVIDTATNHTVGNPIVVDEYPVWVAVSHDGRRAYAANAGSDSVSVIKI